MARPRIHNETVRQRLLEVSSEIIAEHGATALSMRKVATAAGTTTAAIYALFGSREALIEAVVIEGFTRFAEQLQSVVHTDDPAADLLELGKAYRTNALDNPHYYRVMFNNIYGSGTTEHVDNTFGILVTAVQRAVEVETSEACMRAYRLWAYIHGLVSLELAGLAGSNETPTDRETAFIAALRSAASIIGKSSP